LVDVLVFELKGLGLRDGEFLRDDLSEILVSMRDRRESIDLVIRRNKFTMHKFWIWKDRYRDLKGRGAGSCKKVIINLKDRQVRGFIVGWANKMKD